MSNIGMPCRIARAAGGLILAGLLAACVDGYGAPAPGPAPVYMRGADSGWNGGAAQPDDAPPPRYADMPPPAPDRPPSPIAQAPLGPPPAPASVPLSPAPPAPLAEGRRIVLERGESLGLIARRYHASEQAIIAANRLPPPYRVEAGQHLLIPGGDEGMQQAVAPLDPGRSPGGLDGPPPSSAPPPVVGRPPAVVPLDGPAPPAGQGALTPPPAAPPPPVGEPSVAEEARNDGPPSGGALREGRFPWPVRGRVLGTFGAAANGAHNDGINIAAPAGAPVHAIAAGEVAYAGNELRGYGNLVLIKHAGGWISAYAHCEELLVRKGERVSAGQVIAKVGTSGGVGQPQLHFELRRGQHPVDPRQYLAPAPAAANKPTPLG